MNDDIQVKISKDDGHKRRWGLSHLLYRDEGPKKSLNSKLLAIISGFMMVFGMSYSILSALFSPPPSEANSPIPLKDQPINSNMIQIPNRTSDQKKEIVESKIPKSKPTYSGVQILERPNTLTVLDGTILKAKLITGGSDGPVKAVLINDHNQSGSESIPSGSTLLGQGSSGEERLQITFRKIIFPDGNSRNVQAQAVDSTDQTVGIKGKRISKYASLLATGAGLNFLGGLATGLQENETQNGVTAKKSDLKNAALQGASQAALEQSRNLLTDLKNKKSVIKVESGTEFFVLFEGD